MKTSVRQKQPPAKTSSTVLPAPVETPTWAPYALGIFLTFLCAFIVYSPSLEGQFVFDDLGMPFVNPSALSWPITMWLGIRPLLMTTFWANMHLAGSKSTFAYHCVNVGFHASAAVLLFFVLRRILESAKTANRDVLAIFGAGVFLLHPIQTEAVSYVAQRGESMGACLYFTALCVFLYRPPGPISWPRAIPICAIYGSAVVTKEHTATLPALLLLIDYFFNPGYSLEGIKRNWRLYSLIAFGALCGVGFAIHLLAGDKSSVGFQLKEFTPAQFLFTEFRVFIAYIGLFIYPLWQTIDYDFPITKNLLDPGSLIALAVILLLVVTALRYRRRFPLAALGFLAFGTLLLPTSSLIPIRDVIADRRLYLPMIGLLLIVLEFLRRWKPNRSVLIGTLSLISALLAFGSYNRNEKWNSAVSLWADAVEKNPDKPRVQFGLAASQFINKQCHESIPHYQKAIELSKPDYQLEMNLGLAEQCDNHPAEALAALRRSISIQPSAPAWASLGLILAQQGKLEESLDAFGKAEKIDLTYVMTYIYKGGVLCAAGRKEEAKSSFERAVVLGPGNEVAKAAFDHSCN